MNKKALTPGDASRIDGPFNVIQAVQFDLQDLTYALWTVAGTNQPLVPGKTGRLSTNELAISVSVPQGQVGIATVEPRNWPSTCIVYSGYFLGDFFSFGSGPLPYGTPPKSANGNGYDASFATNSMAFTFQSTGILLRESLGSTETIDLTKAGATSFFVTLRTVDGQTGIFDVSEQPLNLRAAVRHLRSSSFLQLT